MYKLLLVSCIVTQPEFTKITGQKGLEGTHMGVNLLKLSPYVDQMLTWIVKQSKLIKGRSRCPRASHPMLFDNLNSRPRATPAAPPDPCSEL